MSQESVQRVRGIYDALSRGDFQSTLDVYDPHAVFFQRDDSNVFGRDVEGVYWGLAGLKDYMRRFLETWSSATIEATEIIEVGDSVVAAIDMRMTGRESGVPVEGQYFHVWTFRGGLVIRLDVLPVREQAFEAVGLSGDAPSQENVQLVRETFDAIGRRDLPKLLRVTSPDVEWKSFFAFGEGGEYEGHDGIRRYVADLEEAWETIQPVVIDWLAVGNLMIVVGSLTYRGKGSGVKATSAAGWVFRIRERRVVGFRAFNDPEQTLEALGLSE